MKAVIQRVSFAKVVVDGNTVGEIEKGILTLLGIEADDTEERLNKLIEKISRLRIFEDGEGKMNLSLLDLSLSHLIVSQFTLCGDTEKGNRPSYKKAAKPDFAKALYDKAIEKSLSLGIKTASGQFQADMKIALLNDGPVTFTLES